MGRFGQNVGQEVQKRCSARESRDDPLRCRAVSARQSVRWGGSSPAAHALPEIRIYTAFARYARGPQNSQGGEVDDLDVQCERLVSDVPQVELDTSWPADPIATIDLRPTCEPWPYGKAPPLVVGVPFDLVGQRRPRTDQAHVAAQNVPQLWKLVSSAGPKEASESWSAFDVPFAYVCGISHRAELHDAEDPPVKATSLLAEQTAVRASARMSSATTAITGAPTTQTRSATAMSMNRLIWMPQQRLCTQQSQRR